MLFFCRVAVLCTMMLTILYVFGSLHQMSFYLYYRGFCLIDRAYNFTVHSNRTQCLCPLDLPLDVYIMFFLGNFPLAWEV